jgi:hypothetical protein
LFSKSPCLEQIKSRPAELTAIRRSLLRSQPLGSDDWVRSTAQRLGLQSTLRPRDRPKKETAKN